MIVVTKDVADYNFSSGLHEIAFTTNQSYAKFSLLCGTTPILSEKYTPAGDGSIEILEIDRLIEPYLRSTLIESFSYTIDDGDKSISRSFKVQYAAAECFYSAADFNEMYFLSTLLGDRLTSPGYQEALHLILVKATDAFVNCSYWDGSTIKSKQVSLGSLSTLNSIVTLDVSPDQFKDETIGKLLRYTVVVGKREQTYILTETKDAAPILLFTNSFGCQEFLYCVGTVNLEPEFTRSTAYEKGLLRNYDIVENRVFKANTGPLSPGMANWTEDLFRSKEIYLVVGGLPGKEITITQSTSKRNNDLDDLPSFTFEYRYAQRNHNILEIPRAGRVFDFTYDNTFE
jgi:hypothetical protein